MDDREPGGVPRWLKTLGIVVAILALLFVIMVIVNGGVHRPRMHGAGVSTIDGSHR